MRETHQVQSDDATRSHDGRPAAFDVTAFFTTGGDFNEQFTRFAESVAGEVPSDMVNITGMGPTTGTLVAVGVWGEGVPSWYVGAEAPLAGSIEHWALAQENVGLFEVTDLEEAKRRFPTEAAGFDAGFLSLASAPMHRGGQLIGFLNFCSTTEHAYSERQIEQIRSIADQVIEFVVISRSQIELQKRALISETLAEIGRTISSSPDID